MPYRVHPFQKLCCVPETSERSAVVLAAAGSSILTFDLTGNLLSHGPPFEEPALLDGGEAEDFTNGLAPFKRRKIEHPKTLSISREASEDSIEIVAERQKGERRKPKVEESKLPNVSHLISTSDGMAIISVTTEDKSINTFELSNAGKLIIKSQRSMPKRLCSIALTPDEHTIIAADKFGDVYSLPLHPSADYIAPHHSVASPNGAFQPSATESTVHTKGNLEALKQQREQKKVNPRKEGPDFEHKLLLGHVSLLTGVAITAVEVASRQRQFILTSDRDEHIRVSRYPQAHIIHGYCLGFREFVSDICILPWAPHFLVAGSGEPSLRVFDWQRCQLVSEVVFDGHLQDTIRDTLADSNGERAHEKLAVTGIWPVNVDRTDKHSTFKDDRTILLVALEGLPVLFSFRFKDDGHIEHHQTVQLSGNVLDVAIVSGASVSALVSVDNIHVPGSMMKESTSTEPCETVTTLGLDASTIGWVAGRGLFSIKTSDVERLSKVPPEAQDQVMRSSRARGEYSSLGEFLYGLENLRKKRDFHLDDVDESTEAMEEHVPKDAQ